MTHTIVAFALLLALTGNGLEGATLTRQPIGIELRNKNGSLRARVFADSENVLLDFPMQQRGYLFMSEYYVDLNRGEKIYAVHSYADLAASLMKRNSPSFEGKTGATDSFGGGFTSTGETDLIAGLTATKIVHLHRAKGEVGIWLNEEITPTKLRAVGKQIMSLLPANYWDDDNRVPTLVQAILLFGVPLRIVDTESESSYVEAVLMKEDDVPLNVFQIPLDYRLSR